MDSPTGVYNWADSDSESYVDLTSDAEDGAGPASMPALFVVSSNPDTLYMRVALLNGREFRIQVDKTAKMNEIDPDSIAKKDRAEYGGNILISPLEWGRLVEFEKTTVVLPYGLTSIEAMAFFGWHMRSIVIPEGVTTIGSMAFYSCPELSSVKFPKTIRSIGSKAFGSCPSLREVTIPLADGVAMDAFDGAFDASTKVNYI